MRQDPDLRKHCLPQYYSPHVNSSHLRWNNLVESALRSTRKMQTWMMTLTLMRPWTECMIVQTRLVKRTLDVEEVVVMDVSHCEVLETLSAEATISVVMIWRL
ncbi:hypothetical protein P692DRAFT_20216534 [Suillus brevipes Sb2]|nr:hypothetical protein P692DRAFT_20216534 [Suillus brevipes Sb2]